jgi:hypothetical protein
MYSTSFVIRIGKETPDKGYLPDSRGGRSGVYDVSVSNQDDEEIAVFSGRSVATRTSILSGE